MIAAGYTTAPPTVVMAICVLMHNLGVAIMMVSGRTRAFLFNQMLRNTTLYSIRRD